MSRRRRRRPLRGTVAAAAVTAAVVAAGCGSPAPTDGEDGGDETGGPAGTLSVAAASSLSEALPAVAEAFEKAHPEVDVHFNFAGSNTLVAQIEHGAAVDVFVSADRQTMTRLTASVAAGAPVEIARNRLTIVVEEGNPLGIGGVQDLARNGVTVVLCAPAVPCGALAAHALDAAGVEVEPASLEENVRAVVSKVALGEADAGIAYRTDAEATGRLTDAVPLAESTGPALEAEYSMVILEDARNPAAAAALQSFLTGEAGQRILERFGFLPAR